MIPISQQTPPITKPIIFNNLAVFALDRPPWISPKLKLFLALREYIIAGIPSQNTQNTVLTTEKTK